MSFPIEAFIASCRALQRSEEFIKETTDFIHKMEAKGFPVIFSRIHFARELGLPSRDIDYLLDSDQTNYTYFLIRKKLSNSKREIMAPKQKMKYLQRWINYNILQKAQFNEHIKGFLPQTSTYKNALVHQGAKYLLKIDLLKFFDCITQKRVYGIFRSFGYPKNLCMDFSELCTAPHRKSYWNNFSKVEKDALSLVIGSNSKVLPQGAPTSPLLANLAATRMDDRIAKLLKKTTTSYTRYADDLCFSTNVRSDLPNIEYIRKIALDEGFFINDKKVHLSQTGSKQYVTGLSITHKVSVSKSKRREIFKHLYFLNKYGLQEHLTKLKEKGQYRTNYKDWLSGHISYHHSINPEVGKKMFSMFNLINWEIEIDINRMSDPSRQKRSINIVDSQ